MHVEMTVLAPLYPEQSPTNLFSVVLTDNEIEDIKSIIPILRKCDCRYNEDVTVIVLPLLEAIKGCKQVK